jgi:hypothetical protein
MIPDHACVPGLERPVTVSEYATLEGLTEAQVLAFIHEFKIRRAKYFRGQWFIEAPRNSEARLAQLRRPASASAPCQPNESGQKIAGNIDRPAIAANIVNAKAESEVAQLHTDQLAPFRSSTKKLSFHELRMETGKLIWGYDDLTDTEKKAILNKKEYADHPQPVDYGLTRDDLDLDRESRVYGLPDGLRYKEGPRWFGRLTAGLKRPSPNLLAFNEALRVHHLYEITAYWTARKAAHEADLRKRSYWTFLDGYAFERATAEVLNKHQFNAFVTPGSGDGGVDIEVTRNGLRGVVQCKAHMECCGPHVVRDLYGVIHHTRVSFGLIVSLGGFTKGAVEFARDKPILFVNLDDLIAMQEGKDVLAEAFSNSSPDTRS